MMLRHRTMAAMLLLGVATSSAAQTTAGIILNCTWDDGRVQAWKFSSTNWYVWDAVAWTWVPRECTNLSHQSAVCSLTMTGTEIAWSLNWQDRSPQSVFVYDANLTVNRLDGRFLFYDNDAFYPRLQSMGGRYEHRNRGQGSCESTTDPALMPKPATVPPPPPPQPRF